LKSVVLYDLSIFYLYLGGLQSSQLSESQALKQRSALIEFSRKQLLCTAADAGQQNQPIRVKQLQVLSKKLSEMLLKTYEDLQLPIVMLDSKEYWDYLYGGCSWNNTKDGLLCVLLDMYIEIDKLCLLNSAGSSASDL